MADQEIKRQTAYKCTIDTVNKGTLVKKQGWESNYIMTEYGDISRVNIIAVVVSKEDNNLNLDDGTGQISGRIFERPEQLQDIDIGDIVLVIGRPREFNNKIYLTIELIRKINPGWVAYRKKELSLIQKIREPKEIESMEKKVMEPKIIESTATIGSKEKISKIIRELDHGEGASTDDVLRLSKVSNGEEIISDMMMRGEIYEAKAGYIKLM
jgi:RPA family protein